MVICLEGVAAVLDVEGLLGVDWARNAAMSFLTVFATSLHTSGSASISSSNWSLGTSCFSNNAAESAFLCSQHDRSLPTYHT